MVGKPLAGKLGAAHLLVCLEKCMLWRWLCAVEKWSRWCSAITRQNTNFIWINQNICGYLELFNVKVVLIFTFSNRLPDIMITLEVSFYIGDFQACLHRAVMPGDLHIPFSFSIF